MRLFPIRFVLQFLILWLWVLPFAGIAQSLLPVEMLPALPTTWERPEELTAHFQYSLPSEGMNARLTLMPAMGSRQIFVDLRPQRDGTSGQQVLAYELHRVLPNQGYATLGCIPGPGYLGIDMTYEFEDVQPNLGPASYRWQVKMMNGRRLYSPLMTVPTRQTGPSTTLTPSASGKKVQLRLTPVVSAKQIRVFDSQGIQRPHTTFGGEEGRYVLLFPRALTAGTYWVQVEGQEQLLPAQRLEIP